MLQTYVEALLESGRHRPPASDSSDSDTNTTHNVTSVDDKPKHYYKLKLPFQFLKIRFDRLALLALLDRSARNCLILFVCLSNSGTVVSFVCDW